MAEPVVVDASSALAVLRGEAAAASVLASLRAVAADAELLVPDHFWLEVVNVLVRRYGWAADEVVVALRELDDLGVATVAIDRPLTLLALDLMSGHRLTAYDAAYLALAEAADASLLTLDAAVAGAAGDRALEPGTGRRQRGAHEDRAAYGSSAAHASWANHGRYLARLRQAVARTSAPGTA